MAITKKLSVSEMILSDSGSVSIKRVVEIFDNGVKIGELKPHREVINPDKGSDGLPQDYKSVAESHWTPRRRKKWADLKAADEAAFNRDN